MKYVFQFFRLLRVYLIFLRYGIDEYVLMIPWFRRIRFIRFLNPCCLFIMRKPRGYRIRLAIEKLGPIFIKFGQALSTRPDIFPDDIITELAKLRDQVPPFSSKQATAIIEKSLKKNITDIYQQFDEIPLASASVAQVHAATLHNGDAVVVKVLRPNVKKVIQKDIALMKTLATLVQHYWSEGERLKPVEIVKEFESTLENELDLMREAANANQLKRNFDNSRLLYVPTVYWDYTHTSVMTIERIYGIPIDDIDELKHNGVDMKKLSERGVEIFFTQVFRDNFFHADMHPGNIFVSKDNPHDPQYIGVDFGIMGSLSDEDKRYLAENFLAFFNRDYRRVAVLHVESHWVPADTRIEEFEGAIRAVCEPIFQRPLQDISFGQLLVRLFQIASRFKMPIQPQLGLLQKTLLNVEGLGRQLYPELDLWQTAKPFLEKWIKTQVGPRALLKKIREQTPFWMEKLPELPGLLYDFLQQETKQQQLIIKKKEHKARRFFCLGIGTALLFVSIFILIFRIYAVNKGLTIFASLAAIFICLSLILK